MIKFEDIKAFSDQIAEKFHPEKIILFGSYAYGTPTEDSDVDLMVIMKHDRRNIEKAIEIRQTLHPKLRLDLLVRKPADIEWRSKARDFFILDVVEKGKILYDSRH
jgi:predicted nucleotidyltransferase